MMMMMVVVVVVGHLTCSSDQDRQTNPRDVRRAEQP
jgi:hypothetical protein